MIVWAQAGCSAPSKESPALWIGKSMHKGDLHSFSNPCWGGTDYYLTLIHQRPVQRKRDLDFFPPIFQVTGKNVVYHDNVRI